MNSLLNPRVYAVQWKNNCCVLLDQTRLPSREIYLELSHYQEVVSAIRNLVVRGAPAIGIAGAYAVVLAMREAQTQGNHETAVAVWERALVEIVSSRPTAVNLGWAVSRMKGVIRQDGEFDESITGRLLEEAKKIQFGDIESNRKMAEFGAALLAPGRVITYCNTGDLATGGIGTAFGVFHEAFRQGKVTHVYPCETRPVMQGMRLTVWELHKNKIPFTLICDNMVGTLLRSQPISAIITGADRIAANGDAANKIGTYSLAVLARHHGVPFYIVAPTSTFDASTQSGDHIPIEERSGDEILGALGDNQPAFSVPIYNPAFDVTPHELITAIVCEKGIIAPPNHETVQRIHGINGSR